MIYELDVVRKWLKNKWFMLKFKWYTNRLITNVKLWIKKLLTKKEENENEY